MSRSERGRDPAFIRGMRFLNTLVAALTVGAPGVVEAQPEPNAAVPVVTVPVVTGPAYIHIDADPEVQLRRHGGRFGTAICTAPCDTNVEVSSDQSFYLEGVPFDAHGLSIAPNQRNIISFEGDQGVHLFGFALFTLGASTMGVGGMVFALHGFVSAVYDDELPTGNIIGYTSMLGGGALLFAIGLPLGLAFEPEVTVHQGDAVEVSIEPNGFAVRF